MTSSTSILVVGAGPVGLALALQLREFGVAVRIVERSARPTSETKAMAIHSRTLEVFDQLGVAKHMLAAGTAIKRFRVQSRGRPILEYGFDRLAARYPLLLSLPQSETERLLEARFNALGGQVERGSELISITPTAARVEAVIRSPSGHEQIHAPWVVGCDGSRSTVRQALGLRFAGQDFSRCFMLADVDIDWDDTHDQGMFFLGDGEGYLGLAPIPGPRRYRLFVELPHELPAPEERPPLELKTFQRMVDERGYQLRLSNASSMTMAEFRQRSVDRLRVGRVLLAGDAAHIGSPIGGQYMNMGINEAHNLAWKLCWVERGHAGDQLLDSYQHERLKVAREAEKKAYTLTRLFTLEHRGALFLRNHALPWVTRGRSAQERLPRGISGHAFDYVGSPAVADQCRGPSRPVSNKQIRGLRAGTLAPDLLLLGERARLLDVRTGPQALLLLFSGELPSTCRWELLRKIARGISRDHAQTMIVRVVWHGASEAPVDADVAVIRDREGLIHEGYAAQRGALYLVRPDGFIGYAGPDGIEADFRRYLERQLHLGAAGASAPGQASSGRSHDAASIGVLRA